MDRPTPDPVDYATPRTASPAPRLKKRYLIGIAVGFVGMLGERYLRSALTALFQTIPSTESYAIPLGSFVSAAIMLVVVGTALVYAAKLFLWYMTLLDRDGKA